MNLKKHLIPNIPYVVIGLFAVIFLISAISLALMALVDAVEKVSMPYRQLDKEN